MPESRTEYWNRIQGLRTSNVHIKDAVAYFDEHYEETDDVIRRFLEEAELTNEEFIAFIAIRRLEGLRRSSGNANSAMMDQIKREYKNTPWKFVEEFLQNADDCSYDGTPEIQIIIDERKSAIEFIYNERGFTRKDIWALTQFSDSTKPSGKDLTVKAQENGLFYNEKTGRKGIGFKSVFSLDAQNIIVHIDSNGFGFRLDNEISSIVPVWEKTEHDDKKTHIRIELVNPNFSLQDIYPQFKDLFCVSNCGRLFCDSPILFMHKLRAVRVEHHSSHAVQSFAVSLNQNTSQAEYGNTLYQTNDILSGISYNGRLCSSELTHIDLTFRENGGAVTVVPCLRYSETIKVNGNWNVFSVISPIIQGKNTWEGGSLFRTFPMIDHRYPIPFAMNLPYELNMARKGISYSDAVAENRLVSDEMFKTGGVFRKFLSYLRACEGISIDQYFPVTPATLFDDTNNRNRDSYYVPLVDLTRILSEEDLFPLYKDEKKYVSLNELACVENQFLDWPEPQKMLSLILGSSFVERLVARRYLSCELLKDKRTGIIDAQFVNHMNIYLQVLEQKFGCESNEFSSFLSSYFYPFLCKNESAINSCDGFRLLSMYLFELFDGSSTTVVRENFNANTIWLDGTNKPSYRRYRTISSSRTDISVLVRRGLPVAVKKASEVFTGAAIQRRASAASKLETILNEIEESTYYGGNLAGITFNALNGYALSDDICEEVNPFRDARLLEIISRDEAARIARSFNVSQNEVLKTARSLGLREADDFFDEVGTFWQFNSLSRKFLSIDNENNAKGFLQLLSRKLGQKKRKLDVTYDEIKGSSTSIKLFLIRNPEYIVREAYDQLCSGILNDIMIWRKKCNESTELLIRAVSKVTSINITCFEPVSIDIKYVIENRLGTYTKRATEKYNFDKYLKIINNGYFEKVPKQEVIDALLATELDEARKKEEVAKTFYRGDLSKCHSEGKAIEFLLDTLSNAVYLHGTIDCDFREAFIYKYLQCRFDAEKNKVLDQIRKQTRPVYNRLIRPMLDRTNDDWDAAFDMLAQDFERMPKEDIINIIARFRLQSYSESLGNASQSHEHEITEDYRQEPWKFAYEFLQNTDDCIFPADVVPEISVAVSRRNNSISFEYNENGFVQDDVNAITSFGNSQKASDLAPMSTLPRTGVFDREKTGRKGRGFKSVFALPGKDIIVHIVSNGYSFRFEKRLGEIIPIWEKADSNACMGTRITIEGFPDSSISTIYDRLLDTLFVKDQRLLFSTSPLLFLKKLRRISLTDGMRTHRFEIEEEKAIYEGDFRSSNVVVSGIRENGSYKASQTAYVIIHQHNANSEPIHVKAIKASYMKDVGGRTRVISIMAPVLTAASNVRYTLGSLYRTLPIDHHKLPAPIAINTAFNLNSGRSALLDEQNQLNNELNKLVFNVCLPKAMEILRCIPNIAIDAYIPERSNSYNTLFNGMIHVDRIDIRRIIRSLSLLKRYSGSGFVSCDDASVLPAECYTWPLPICLARIFDNANNDNLVLQEYGNKIDELHIVQIINNRFCTHINTYLDEIESNDPAAVWPFLSNKLYAYISRYYNDLRRSYIGNEDDLLGMRIFAYTDANDQNHRESGDQDNIWLMNCPTNYKSYSICRVFDSAPVHYDLNRDKWIVELLHAVDFKDFRAVPGYEINTWDETVLWLKIGLYYHRSKAGRLTYLRSCVLSEVYSPEENIFRKAYQRSEDKNILQRIINKQDIDGIVRELNLVTNIPQIDVVNAIKQRGLRKEDDFFESNPEFIKLNKPTLAVFRAAGFDRTASHEYVQTVVKVFNNRYRDAALNVSFAELKDCSPVLFTCIFRLGLINGDTRSRIAKCFFEEIENRDSSKAADYVEAYLCCMSFVKEPLEVCRTLNITLTEIINRKLGECIQRAQFNQMSSGSVLTITRDIPCMTYESREIKRSLHWLSGDTDAETEIMKYSYYTADLSEAFTKANTSRYVFDNNTVIVNAQNPQEHILDFVKHKYTAAGDKELLVGLIKIAGKQYELQENWHGTKREFISKLAAFRSETEKYINFLCPGYQRGINEATGDAAGNLIPELLQNINDCRNESAQSTRSLSITMDNHKNCMTLIYDERGFQYADVYSITAYGQSTKHDEREGEKGLGFKKVFTVFSQVDIYSNGFAFRLSASKPTIPQWIEISDSNTKLIQTGKTTMVFTFADPEKTAQRINSIWESAMKNAENASLFLGLRNITEYRFTSATGIQVLTRKQILQKFYHKDLPLIATYRQLHNTVGTDMISTLKAKLRSRKKCNVMDNAEFERYLQQLTVSVYVPRKSAGTGLFYSTLPTAKASGCSMFIDVPLELSTARNEVMVDSMFNDAIMCMLYEPSGAKCSVMSYVLSCIAAENFDCRLYEYIPDVDTYLSVITNGKVEGQNTVRAELFNLPIVHTQNREILKPVSCIFTAPRIVYDYMHDVKDPITHYDVWLTKHHPEIIPNGNMLASYQDGIRRSLKNFAVSVGASAANYPLSGTDNEYVVQYFETEYGTEGGD